MAQNIPARTKWTPPPARVEGDRLLKARAAELRVRNAAVQTEAQKERTKEILGQELGTKVEKLEDTVDRLIDNLPRIVPNGGGGGKRTIARVLEQDAIFLQDGAGAVHRTPNSKLREVISVADFGAKPNGMKVAVTATIASGSASLTATGAAFTKADIGKSISIPKAGAAGATLNTSIRDVSSSSQATLADNAQTAVSASSTYIYYGNDNTTAFQSAINALLAIGGGTLPVGRGKYWFAKASASLDPGMGNITIRGEGRDATVLMWEGGDTVANYAGADSKSLFKNLDATDGKGFVRFEKITMQGTFAAPSFANSGGVAFWLDHYDSVEMIDAGLRETKATGMSVRYGERFVSRGCYYTDIAAGSIYMVDTFDTLITGNKFLRDGDDSISCHTSSAAPGLGRRPREGTIITDNIITCCGATGIRVLGARQAKINNNVIRLSGHGIMVGYVANEGKVVSHDISICDNTIENLFVVSSSGVIANTGIGINIATDAPRGATSTNSTIPGFYDITGGVWIYPWDYIDVNTATATNPVPPASGIVVRGNKVRRTVPATGAFSNYGYGRIIRSGVYYDGAVVTANLRQNTGINFSAGGLHNAIVSENIIEHMSFGINFAAPTSDRDYTNVKLRGNMITDCISRGISMDTSAFTSDIDIEGGVIDCDPYRQGAVSNADGTYSGTGNVRGIATFNNVGISISRVHFKNCSIPVYSTTTAPRLTENVVWCNPVGGTGFSASNKGIGDVPLGGNYRHVIYQCDPTLADYRQLVTNPVESSGSIPSTGTYVRGHFVRSEIPTIDGNNMTIQGWTRITTGTGHTSGTDWVVARTSHVSPAT